MAASGFTIGLRVRILNGQTIAGIDSPRTMSLGAISLSAAMLPPVLTLKASGFGSEEEAEGYLPRLRCGLMNLALRHHLAFRPTYERIDVGRPEDPRQPERAHGSVAGEGYYICRTGEGISFFSLSEPTLSVGRQWHNLETAFLDGVRRGRADAIAGPARLSTALDLYVSSFRESTIEARFITLVSCLEVLAPEKDRHPAVVALFDDFKEDLKLALTEASDEAEKRAIEAALDDTKWKKKESISARIRELIRSGSAGDDQDVETLVRRVNEAYAIRGLLLHEGHVDADRLGEAADTVFKAVQNLLANELGLS